MSWKCPNLAVASLGCYRCATIAANIFLTAPLTIGYAGVEHGLALQEVSLVCGCSHSAETRACVGGQSVRKKRIWLWKNSCKVLPLGTQSAGQDLQFRRSSDRAAARVDPGSASGSAPGLFAISPTCQLCPAAFTGASKSMV